jgi:hypothetical protein
MWLGWGTWFPLTQGWYGGIRTGAAFGWRARAHREWLVGSTDAGMCVLGRPADVESLVCRDIRADGCQRKPFLHEVAIPYSALARGPPDRSRKHPIFKNGFAKSAASTRRNR